MKTSIVIPVLNEAENIADVICDIDTAMADHDYEIIVVDDASTDNTVETVRKIIRENGRVRLLVNRSWAGQSAAIHSAVLAANGEIIATLDGDGQNPPSEIPGLIKPFFDRNGSGNLGLVAGQRKVRYDTLSKRLASQFANALQRRLLGSEARDSGCALRAFLRNAFLELPYFNHMHRFLPVLFARAGWTVEHVPVSHRPRAGGKSKYSNFHRGLVGIFDLFGVYWLLKRKKTATSEELRP